MRHLRFLLTCTTALAAIWLLLANLHVAPVSAASPQGGSVVINEFFVRGTAGNLDWVELHNPTGAPIDMTGWYVDDAATCGAGISFLGATILPAGGHLAITEGDAGANFGLNTIGEPIVLCTGAHALVNQIAYGNVGGAPLHSAGLTTARVGAAQDTGDDAADFNLTITATKGTVNNVPTTNLGNSLVINEVDITQVVGNDAIEIYNPTGAAVDLLGWSITDGSALTTFIQTLIVPANGYVTLVNGTHFSFSLVANDVLHLLNPSGVRVDQLGWGAEIEDNCFARVPDGAGPHNGYNFATSGGNTTLLDQPCTLGGPNAVTFVYHDLEDVVLSGETVYLAGDFNGWNATANPLTADGGFTTFSVTLPLTAGTYGYKYLVNSEWDWLNTNNRSVTIAANNTVNDYRHVVPGWANLQFPATMTATVGQATSSAYGQLFINNVTNPAGAGRGVQAQVGLGNSGDLNSWDWFPMSFNTQAGNNDEFGGTMTPDIGGVLSYTTRFNGNWGTGNPHSAWYYGDLDGNNAGGGFSLDQTGVITVMVESIVWDGGGADNNWNTAANWNPDRIPTATDLVIFNGTSSKNAFVNVPFTIYALQVNTGYNGTIAQATNAFSILTEYTHASGTMVVSPIAPLTVVGTAMNHTGGTLRQTLTVNAANVPFLTITDGGPNIRYRGIEVDTSGNGNNLSNVTVNIRRVDGTSNFCTQHGGASPAYALRCFSFYSLSPAPAVMRFWVHTSELNGLTPASLQPYRNDAGGPVWNLLSPSTTGNDGGAFVYTQATVAEGFGSILVGGAAAPTAVTLQHTTTTPAFPSLILATLLLLILTGWAGWRVVRRP